MERKFTGFLVPILIGTLVYLLFFSDGPSDKSQPQTQMDDLSLQDPAVREAIRAQPQHDFDPDVEQIVHRFGRRNEDGF